MRIQTIDENSPFLKSVIKLGDENRKFLGFFPQKAFRKGASDGLILCAVDNAGKFSGYLLYYVAYERAVIQQLCVDTEVREKGVGRALVERLKEVTDHLDGILLHCRRDFPSHQFWPEVGFVAVGEKSGRGKKKQSVLTRYWYDHGHRKVFSRDVEEAKVVAVMDANVIFDLQDLNDKENECAALLADWLNENVEFKITDEVLNEINRQRDDCERSRRRQFAGRFSRVEHVPSQVEDILKELQAFLPKTKKPSDRSDHRQLAMAVSGSVEFFLTQDADLCQYTNQIFHRLGITVVHPAEFVLRIDELLRRVDYQPVRLSGSQIKLRRVRSDDVTMLAGEFLSYWAGERIGRFEGRLRSVLSQTETNKGLLIEDVDNKKLGLIVVSQEKEVFSIPFFRVRNGTLAPTLARAITMLLVKQSCALSKSYSITVVTESHLDKRICASLQELGFSKSGDTWVKINTVGIEEPTDMASKIRSFCAKYPTHRHTSEEVSDLIEDCGRAGVSHDFILKTERKIWPGKLASCSLPIFIVPIQPRWAMHLFDEDLAKQDLFGADTNISLVCENVYYRGKYPKVLKAPGRIIWYVSYDKKYQGSKSIRACSVLHEVVFGRAKELFNRFDRLGIYDWNHVRGTAKGNAEGEIMAFRFGLTETFRNPITWEEAQSILRAHRGTEPPLSTPVKIAEDCFKVIYTHGTKNQ